MRTLTSLPWPLVVGLGVLALLRPAVKIVQDQAGMTSPAALSVILTVVITAVWVAVVGLTRVDRPVPTLVAAGLCYGVLSILLSGIASPILTGRLQGPLAMPIAIIPVLLTNAVWGAVAGLLALVVRRLFRAETPAGSPIRRR